MRLDELGNMPNEIIKDILEIGMYDNAIPKEKKIKSYISALVFLNEWKEEGWLDFQADNAQIAQKYHYVTVKWKSKTQDEALQAKEFAKVIGFFDTVSPDYDGEGNMALGVSLYNPTK